MHDKKEEKQIKETLNQLDDQLLVKISEINDLVNKREKLILMLQRELLKNERSLLEKRGSVAKNLYQLLSKKSIAVISSKEETVDLKKETNELMQLCTKLIEKRCRLNIKIQSLEQSNRQLIKCIDVLYKKVSTEQEVTVNNKLSSMQSDSPIFATNHPQIGAEQVTPDINM